MKKELQYYYVHGLHSSKNAKKFKDIQIKYPNAICLDWLVGDNLAEKIKDWVEVIKESKLEAVLIGSSTGCNLIVQMNQLLATSTIHPKTIFLNPLLSLEQVLIKELMPEEVEKYISEINYFKDYLLIVSDSDEVLDHKKISLQIKESNQMLISENDNHKLLKFKDHFETIDAYIHF
ncbi:YqiA/YcfP family alpha/beta fold hydrolase [Flavobacterium sp. TMP13]|uniref:YqiA/YcfP family alpha/beta fold hydrolase n=1 Tax=Flavobacterium sp. TMP13 TaxID=3425950 RepID=UPI003D777F8F